MGVQSPIASSPLVTNSRPWSKESGSELSSVRWVLPWRSTCAHCPARTSNKANPVHEFGKDEKSRCRLELRTLNDSVQTIRLIFTLEWVPGINPSGLDESAPNSQHHRLSPVARPEFCQQVLDVTLRGFFVNRQCYTYLAVRVPICQQLQNLKFPRRQRRIGRVKCQIVGDLRLNSAFSIVNRSDGFQHLLMRSVFENIGLHTGPEGPLHADISAKGAQYNEARLLEFAAYSVYDVEPFHVWQLHVQQCDIGSGRAERLYTIPPIGCLTDQGHIGPLSNQRRNSFAKKRMIIDG